MTPPAQFIGGVGLAPDALARVAAGTGAHGLAAGHEPLTLASFGGSRHVEGNGSWIVAGAVTNAAELARRLGGSSEASHARLVARGWQQFGEGILPQLRGDFAVVFWDAARREGVVACDQLGNRAVVYHEEGARLLFATEVSLLLEALPRRPAPDPQSVARWLAGGGPPIGHTHYTGVRRLPGGWLLRFGRRVAAVQWWQPAYEEPRHRDHADSIAELREQLTVAARRAAGDVDRSGILLSGGLDSAAVAGACGSAGLAGRMRCYSATFPEHPAVDESELIVATARSTALRARAFPARPQSLLPTTREYIRACKAPPSSPNLFFWLPMLRRAAEDGVLVMLDGEGGDELFGPSGQLGADLVRGGHPLAAWRLTGQFPGAAERATRAARLRLLRGFVARGAMPRSAAAHIRPPGFPRTAPPWFNSQTATALSDSDERFRWNRRGEPAWWRGLLQVLIGQDGPVLARDHIRRRSAMAGLSVAHPLLDVDVVEQMLRLPPQWGFDAGLSRPVLRDAVRGWIPEAVRLRPTKSRFDAVFLSALREVDGAAITRLLEDPGCLVGEYVDLPRMRDELVRAPTGPTLTWATYVWRTVTTELWLRD